MRPYSLDDILRTHGINSVYSLHGSKHQVPAPQKSNLGHLLIAATGARLSQPQSCESKLIEGHTRSFDKELRVRGKRSKS